MENLKVSVITVCYNSAKTIEQTIQSVINQSYPYIEYIIIDGGSTDGTLDIIRKYESHIAKWVSEPDEGIYDAMNKGIRLATGEVVGIINSDDWYAEDILARIARYFNENKVQWVHGDLITVDDNGKLNYLRGDRNVGSSICQWYDHPTVFVRRSVYKKFGMFDTKYTIYGDIDFMLRLQFHRIPYGYIPQKIAFFRLSGISNSKELSYSKLKEIKEILKRARYRFNKSDTEYIEFKQLYYKIELDTVYNQVVFRMERYNTVDIVFQRLLSAIGKRTFVIWGAGADGKELVRDFNILSWLEYFVDIDAAKQRIIIFNKKVSHPNELRDDEYVVVASRRFENDIKKELQRQGKKNEKDFTTYSLFQLQVIRCYIEYIQGCVTNGKHIS